MKLSEVLQDPVLRTEAAKVWNAVVAKAFPDGSEDLLRDGQNAVALLLAAQAAGDELAERDAKSALDALLLTQLDRIDEGRDEFWRSVVFALLGVVRSKIPILGDP